MDNKNCLQCDKPLHGRVDKKFCDTQCKASYNNRNKRKSEKVIAAVNRQIRKNRTILKTLCPEGKAKVRKSKLEDLGFSFAYFSSIYSTNKTIYYFCYEYGYAAIEEAFQQGVIQKVLIVQHQDYMKGSFDPWKKQ